MDGTEDVFPTPSRALLIPSSDLKSRANGSIALQRHGFSEKKEIQKNGNNFLINVKFL